MTTKSETIAINDASCMQEWDSFVHAHPACTPSHLSGWLKTTADAYGFRPILYCVRDKQDKIQAVFPLFRISSFLTGKRIISLPFSDYGGPLITPSFENNEINRILDGICKKGNQVEIRGTVSCDNRFIRNDYYKRHILDLKRDKTSIYSSINKKTIQRSIRKAEEAGIKVTMATDIQGMTEFIRLNNLTRKKHGVPSQPRKWFDLLQKHIIQNGNGFIMLAELNKCFIGASLFLTSGTTIHYKYNASDPEKMRQVSPNHLILWETIKWGVENNFTSIDFGRTSPDNEGLIRYKEMWGVTTIDLPYYYYPMVKGASSMKEKSMFYQLSTSMWKLLPSYISEPLSTMIFRHLT